MSDMVLVRASATIDAAPEVLFDRIADYRSAPQLIDGLDSMSPTGTVTSGKGARFSAVMRVGPRTFAATIEITEYELPHRLTWSSSGRDSQALTFAFAPTKGSHREPSTTVTLEISYERPGGLSGVLVAPIVEQTVRSKAHSTLERLRADVA